MELTPSHGQAPPDSPYRHGAPGERVFKHFNGAIRNAIIESFQRGAGRLFTVSTDGLYDIYLNSFNSDPIERKLHTCRCCEHFIRHYGGLVYLNESGASHTAVWNEAHLMSGLPEWYWTAIRALANEVEKRLVTSQFLWSPANWGVEQSGGFSHFFATPQPCAFEATLSPGQAMAVRREDFKHLAIVVKEWKAEHLGKAVGMLQAGGLANAPALLPMAQWLRDVQHRVHGKRGKTRDNILWHAVSHAARGWCTPRGSALGALMDDIISGRGLAATTRAHDERMHPLKYQRPQAPPSAGNVVQAEKIFEKLGLAAALRRKPMAFDEVKLFWRPRTSLPRQPNGGVFGHLKTKDGPPPATPNTVLSTGVTVMTWAKFERDVLPRALKLHLKTPPQGSYCCFTTATDPAAPPIMKWDSPEHRNPGDWFTYNPSSPPSLWGLPTLAFVEVLGLAYPPSSWTSNHESKPLRVQAILQGARIERCPSLAIFPQSVKSELHEVRATIEAASKAGRLDPEPRQHASGYLLGGKGEATDLCVTTDVGLVYYRIDRLE